MAKVRVIKTSFVSGELAGQVFGRIDKDFYGQGADKLRNVYVNPLGGIFKREGLRIIDQIPDNKKGLILDFVFNNEQTYLFLFVPGLIRIYNVQGDNITIDKDLTGEIPDSLTPEIIKHIKFVQSADTLIITQQDIAPIKITRIDVSQWSIEKIKFEFIPYWAFNGTTTTKPNASLSVSAENGTNITVTANVDTFNPNSVGQLIIGDRGGTLVIKRYTNPKVVVGDVVVDFPGTGIITLPASQWSYEVGYEQTWSDTRGYPKTCTFFQGRLWFGGSKSRPATLWGSQTGKFFNFDEGNGLVDQGIERIIDDDKINAIVNLYPGRSLQIFTTGGEFFIPQSNLEPITPTNTVLLKSTMHGSSDVRPVSIDGSTLFIERTGRVVREYIYNELERSYSAKSISLLSSQLIREPISMDVCQSRKENPADYALLVNSDGTIAVLNILRSEALVAWSLFETKGFFECVSVVDKQIFVIVKRTIGGVEKRFIEYFDRNYYMDASMRGTSETPTTTFSGFQYLANQAVNVRAESFVLDDSEVNNEGEVTISLDYKNVEIGLNFIVLVKFLPVDIDLGSKTLTGDWRNVKYIMVKSFNTKEYIIICGNNKYRPSFRKIGSNLLDKPIDVVSDWKKIYLSGGVSRDATVMIYQESPEEFQIIFVVIAISV